MLTGTLIPDYFPDRHTSDLRFAVIHVTTKGDSLFAKHASVQNGWFLGSDSLL